MTLRNEELLSRFFERKMTSNEEQNFLISVAANDELRLAFRSQMELTRAVREDKDTIRNAAQVRARTLAALGLSTIAAESFFEHDLMAKEAEKEAMSTSLASRPQHLSQVASPTNPVMRFFQSPVATVLSGLTIGFFGAMAIFSDGSRTVAPTEPSVVTSPVDQLELQPPEVVNSTDLAPESTPNPEVTAPVRQAPVETNTSDFGLQKGTNDVKQPEVIIGGNDPATVIIKPKINKPDSGARVEEQK